MEQRSISDVQRVLCPWVALEYFGGENSNEDADYVEDEEEVASEVFASSGNEASISDDEGEGEL